MNEFEQQIGIVHDCLRGIVFGDFIANKKPKYGAWPSIMDMCYADAIISWNQIFGQKSQETHWSNFVKKITIPDDDKLKLFNKEVIIGYLEITNDEWSSYHSSMVSMRNIRIAHLNLSESLEEMPNITLAFHSCYIYREWLIEVLYLQKRLGLDIKITDQNGHQVLDLFKEQIKNAYNRL